MLAGLVLAALGAWASFERSGIAAAWSGTVTAIDIRAEKHPGVDDVWFVAVDGQRTHLDSSFARTLKVGDQLSKQRWSRTVEVNGVERRLRVSDDAKALAAICAGIALVTIVCAWPPGQAPPLKRIRVQPHRLRR
jgi:hypothetical protein